MNDEIAIEKIHIKGVDPDAGPCVLFFGAIHGDEHCGPAAIREIVGRFSTGSLVLKRGVITFVPVCNPKAYADHTRAHKENLNRIFHKTENPDSYEARLANQLCILVDEHDVLLDIHSSFVPAPSNAFVDYPTPENLSFAKALNTDYLIFDWPAVYENNEFAFPAWTTDRYAHEAGKMGVLVECGKHDDPEAKTRAEDAIIRTLLHFKLIDPLDSVSSVVKEARSVYMNRIFRRDSIDDHFEKTWSHLDKVPAGALIAVRSTGERIVAEHDSYILFPKDYAIPGGEWFYLGSAKWGIERS